KHKEATTPERPLNPATGSIFSTFNNTRPTSTALVDTLTHTHRQQRLASSPPTPPSHAAEDQHTHLEPITNKPSPTRYMAGPPGAGRRKALDFDDVAMFVKGTSMARAMSPSVSEATSRSSFSSVRENDDGFAQTFTRSKISSYTETPEDVFDESPIAEVPQAVFRPALTNPGSKLHGFWFPAEGFKGWREIPIKGRIASRSSDDLRKLHMTWDNPAPKITEPPVGVYPPSAAPLESLPSEILSSIIDLLVVEIPPNGLTTRNTDLMSLLRTSRSIHAATLTTLYRHITIPHSRIFRKFLTTITEYPVLATIVRRLDFSHFNPSIMFSTAAQRLQAQNLTSETLFHCLALTPYLKEFLAQDYIDDDLGPDVLRKLLFDMPSLTSIDFCGCSSLAFKRSFTTLLDDVWPETLTITKLSFHKSLSLPSALFETILPRLPNVTHLDLAETRVTDKALLSIPESAALTHLNLARCKELSADVVIKFVTSHPATKNLVFLSLGTDPSTHLLLGKSDLDALLPNLPASLKSLSLRGSRMDSSHIEQLTRLSQTLEELAVGRGLAMADIHRLFFRDQQWQTHNLKYIDICDVETIIGSASTLLAPASAPLLVVELSERAYERAAKVKKNLQRVGWDAQEFGSRYWLTRTDTNEPNFDHGHRSWKMGAKSWGMRKIPTVISEVGGMYGSYMFGRRL
ncbi:Leucine Rich Repeat domain, partial [Cordyceps militaris]